MSNCKLECPYCWKEISNKKEYHNCPWCKKVIVLHRGRYVNIPF